MRPVFEQLDCAWPILIAENRYFEPGPLQTRHAIDKRAFPGESGLDLQTEYPRIELDLRVEVYERLFRRDRTWRSWATLWPDPNVDP